jgi:hypothetical protein
VRKEKTADTHTHTHTNAHLKRAVVPVVEELEQDPGEHEQDKLRGLLEKLVAVLQPAEEAPDQEDKTNPRGKRDGQRQDTHQRGNIHHKQQALQNEGDGVRTEREREGEKGEGRGCRAGTETRERERKTLNTKPDSRLAICWSSVMTESRGVDSPCALSSMASLK